MSTNTSMPIVPVQEWGQAITTSLTGALMILLGAIPRIIGFGVILVVGWFIASLVGRGLAGFLRLVDFNGMAQRSGLGAFLPNRGPRASAAAPLAPAREESGRALPILVDFD